MRFNFLYLFLIAIVLNAMASEKFPYGLLTSGFGIVTDDDLAFDDSTRKITPYDSQDQLGSLHWQCFPRKEVIAKFDSWKGNDGMGAWNKIYTMCTIEIDVRHEGELQIYADRRAHQIGFCRDFMNAWRKITKNQRYLCLNGDGGGYEQDEKDGKYKLWTWEKFKTKLGCYSYFSDVCDTSLLKKKKVR